MTVQDLRLRVRGEYAEMPGLRLTVAQASRLWNIDRNVGESVLNALVEERFLFRTSDGAYMMWPARRAAKVAAPTRKPSDSQLWALGARGRRQGTAT